ncbi:hypothetical protein P5E67_00710 [Vibrio parahaemolyticus]|nr:hypothetical protein [Vibrio parahaemolyticus]
MARARKRLTEYEKAIRSACRAYAKAQELIAAARAETDAERARIAEMNKSRRGRPARNAKELAEVAQSKYQKAIDAVREIERKEGHEAMSEIDIQTYHDPIQNKESGAGHSGQPKNNEIDDLEALIRRIRKRIIAIDEGSEVSKYMTKEEKISGCEKQIEDAQERIKELEATLTEPEMLYQEIKRARQRRREAKAALKRAQMLCAVQGVSDEVFDEAGNINPEMLAVKNALNVAETQVQSLEKQYKDEYGEFKNDVCGADDLTRRLMKNEIATRQAAELMTERKSKVQTIDARNRRKNDSKIGRRFAAKNQ